MASSFRLDYRAIASTSGRLDRFSPVQMARVQKRTLGTLNRRLPTEASRLISAQVLNVSTRVARQGLSSQIGGGSGAGAYVELRGSAKRLGVEEFRPRVSRSDGVTVQYWKDGSAARLPQAFRRPGNRAIWQRVPYSPALGVPGKPGGLVHRLPVVVRKGPSLPRAVVDKKHGDIYPPLLAFARTILSAEVARLLKVESQ